MDRLDPYEFAEAWAAAWNHRDVNALLDHFHEEVLFTSPRAAALAGRAVVEGKAALRAYWETAASNLGQMQFAVEDVTWDRRAKRLCIRYVRSPGNGRKVRACEFLQFRDDGFVSEGEAMYGAEL